MSSRLEKKRRFRNLRQEERQEQERAVHVAALLEASYVVERLTDVLENRFNEVPNAYDAGYRIIEFCWQQGFTFQDATKEFLDTLVLVAPPRTTPGILAGTLADHPMVTAMVDQKDMHGWDTVYRLFGKKDITRGARKRSA